MVAQRYHIQSFQFKVHIFGNVTTGSDNRVSFNPHGNETYMTYHQPTDRSRAIACMHKSIRSIGRNMISQKKAEILSSTEADSKGRVEKKNIQGRDLLSLLIKANMATDIPDHARMTDEDILARKSSSSSVLSAEILTTMRFKEVPTFILAGHETTRYFCNLLYS